MSDIAEKVSILRKRAWWQYGIKAWRQESMKA